MRKGLGGSSAATRERILACMIDVCEEEMGWKFDLVLPMKHSLTSNSGLLQHCFIP